MNVNAQSEALAIQKMQKFVIVMGVRQLKWSMLLLLLPLLLLGQNGCNSYKMIIYDNDASGSCSSEHKN